MEVCFCDGRVDPVFTAYSVFTPFSYIGSGLWKNRVKSVAILALWPGIPVWQYRGEFWDPRADALLDDIQFSANSDKYF